MPIDRTAQQIAALLKEAAIQGELFSSDDPDLGKQLLTAQDELRALPQEGDAAARHTAGTLVKRVELVEMICDSLIAGLSQRDCAKRYKVGRNTLAALVERLERDGQMEPHKRRMSRKLGQLAEVGVDAMIQKAWEGKISSIDVAIAVDKKALLDGDPTSRMESVHVELTAEDLRREYERLRPSKATVEVESMVVSEKPKEITGK